MSPAPTPGPRSACSPAHPAKSRDAVPGSEASACAEPVRRLRPRNVQPEYNEDRAFEALIHPADGVLPISCSVTESSDGSVRKPDHLVVVYKHSPERQAETPNRMRLLPAVTLNKLQAGLHHPKTGTADTLTANCGRFPAEAAEPENDCIDQNAFYQYLNLIPSAAIAKRPVAELKQKWPLRHHSRTWPSTRAKNSITSSPAATRPLISKALQTSGNKSALSELQSRSEQEKNMWFSGLKSKEKFVTSQKTPQNVLHLDPNGVLHLIPSVSGLCENSLLQKQSHVQRKQSSSSSCSSSDVRSYPVHDQELFCGLPLQSANETIKAEQRKTMLKRFVKKYLLKPAEYYKPGVEMSSPLGKRLLDAYSPIVSLQSVADVVRFVKSYERHCSTSCLSHRQLLQSIKCSFSPKVKIDFSLPSPSKTNLMTCRVLRSQLTISPTSNAWGLKSYHIYAFSKQERLEKSLTVTAGLDWKGRLLALHCEDISLDVHKITCCEVCQQPVSPDAGHSCGSAFAPDTSQMDPAQEDDVVTLDDSFEETYETHDLNQNQMIHCDEDDEEMEEEEEVILIGGPSSFCSPSGSAEGPDQSSNYLTVTPNRSPVELLIEF